uniref:Uncharacterized protein MANES_03G099900 n=1 Tax=Rhizophora mucronata TaxID=61149 RepID=A0A2P2PIM4_RHIMU
MKEEPGWPSFGQLIIDLSKLVLEAFGSVLLHFIPSRLKPAGSKKGLTPLKDSLRMPEDEVEHQSAEKQGSAACLPEMRQVHTPLLNEKYTEVKPPKIKSAKDPSLSNKHRSSKRQEHIEFYGSGDVPSYGRSKSHKDKTRHRQRDKGGEVVSGAVASEQKHVDMKPMEYSYSKFDHSNIRSKYGPDDSY